MKEKTTKKGNTMKMTHECSLLPFVFSSFSYSLSLNPVIKAERSEEEKENRKEKSLWRSLMSHTFLFSRARAWTEGKRKERKGREVVEGIPFLILNVGRDQL